MWRRSLLTDAAGTSGWPPSHGSQLPPIAHSSPFGPPRRPTRNCIFLAGCCRAVQQQVEGRSGAAIKTDQFCANTELTAFPAAPFQRASAGPCSPGRPSHQQQMLAVDPDPPPAPPAISARKCQGDQWRPAPNGLYTSGACRKGDEAPSGVLGSEKTVAGLEQLPTLALQWRPVAC